MTRATTTELNSDALEGDISSTSTDKRKRHTQRYTIQSKCILVTIEYLLSKSEDFLGMNIKLFICVLTP